MSEKWENQPREGEGCGRRREDREVNGKSWQKTRQMGLVGRGRDMCGRRGKEE